MIDTGSLPSVNDFQIVAIFMKPTVYYLEHCLYIIQPLSWSIIHRLWHIVSSAHRACVRPGKNDHKLTRVLHSSTHRDTMFDQIRWGHHRCVTWQRELLCLILVFKIPLMALNFLPRISRLGYGDFLTVVKMKLFWLPLWMRTMTIMRIAQPLTWERPLW